MASLRRLAVQVPAGARMASGGSATAGKHAEKHAKMWENLTFFGVIPLIITASYLGYQHEKHHDEPPPPYVEYEHMRIRKKNFPWGDGKKSFFHNPKTNPLPGVGYEEEWKPKAEH